MKIGFDAKRFYNNYTGLGNYSRTLVLNLLSAHPEHDYFLYTTKISVTPEITGWANNKRLTTILPSTPLRSLWRSYLISGRMRRDAIDIYHGLSGEIPVGLSKGKTLSVVTIHDLIFRRYPETYKPADRFIYDRKFRYACNNADCVVAISESTRNDIIDLYGIDENKVRVIYQACDPIFYAGKDPSATEEVESVYNLPHEFLLYVGSVIPRKNLVTIIKAMTILPDDLRLPLVVIGKGGSYRDDAKKLVRQNKLEDRVIWINGLNNTRHLKAIYSLARIFIYPSVYEGFGLPVSEALLSGAPVITSNTSSMPEAGGPRSYYIDPLNADQMAAGIEKILTDSQTRDIMISEGYKYASAMFSPGATAEALNNLYLVLAGNGNEK